MSEPLVVKPRNRIKISAPAKTDTTELISLAEIPVGDGSRRIGNLGSLSIHQTSTTPRAVACEVVLLQSVYKKVVEHLSQETTREHGGFLLGYETTMGDEKKPAVLIMDAVPAKFTRGSPVQLTFTTDTWRDLDDEISRHYGEADRVPQRVGWYHSHPNIRIFLSHWDLDVCRTYERRRYPVALVVDPIQNRGGFFVGGSKGYDPHSAQGFYEAHDLEKSSIVTWKNMTGGSGVEVPLSLKAIRSGRNENEAPLTIYRVTAEERRTARLRRVSAGLMGLIMAIAIGYLYVLARTQQSEIDALRRARPILPALAPGPPTWEMTIVPPVSDLAPSQQVAFQAERKGFDDPVWWSIDPSNAGSISPVGVYKAPATIAKQSTVSIKAMSVADTTKFASAQVRLLPPVNADVSVDVTPAKIRLQASKSYRFQAKVSGTWQERKAGVKWTISPPDRGKIGKDGVYTAPANFPAEASVVVSAISVAVPTKFAESTIALVKDASVDGGSAHAQAKDNVPTESAGALAAASPQQTLTVLTSSSGTPVTPTLEVTSDKATLSEGESARFSATFGGAEADVIWSLEPSGVGRLSTDGQYTAPEQLQPEGVTVTIIARSKDASRTAKKVINLKPRTAAASNPGS
jgi:proteasome lid subunit RPN8/RPN11